MERLNTCLPGDSGDTRLLNDIEAQRVIIAAVMNSGWSGSKTCCRCSPSRPRTRTSRLVCKKGRALCSELAAWSRTLPGRRLGVPFSARRPNTRNG